MQFGNVLATVVLLAGLALTGLVGCGLLAPDSVEGDRAALVELYNATGGPQWTNNENWLSNKPLGAWYGVATNSEGRVTELELGFPNGNNLTGPIPPELGNLSSLEILDLGVNQLSAPIPPELGKLSGLEILRLGGNQLTGTIPPELGNLSNLESVNLIVNQLTGTIPAELGNLSNLESLLLMGNQLTGTIPAELGNLSNLETLGIWGNQLTGPIPQELGKLSNLGWLWYEDNAGLCMPRSLPMQNWRRGIRNVEGPDC